MKFKRFGPRKCRDFYQCGGGGGGVHVRPEFGPRKAQLFHASGLTWTKSGLTWTKSGLTWTFGSYVDL